MLPRFDSYKPKKYIWPKSYYVDGVIEENKGVAIGIDPGVNYGITLICAEKIRVIHGKLPRQEKKGMHGVDAYNTIRAVFADWMFGSELVKHINNVQIHGVVEGAAYDKVFGQVGLEEVRFGFFLGLYNSQIDVSILAPRSVRKIAFDSGNTTAFDMYPTLNHNGADSLGCALAALKEKK